jgi:hypothetical protein
MMLVTITFLSFKVPLAIAAGQEGTMFTFNANVRMNTFWEQWSKEAAPGGLQDDSDLTWALDTKNSRFGANFKSGDLSGMVEIRPLSNLVRHWYGNWNFGSGNLIVGQTWAPTFVGQFGCVLDGGLSSSYGSSVNSLRAPQIALWFPIGNGTLRIAGLEPYVGTVDALPAAYGDTDLIIPKMEFVFDQKFGFLQARIYGGYNTFDKVDQVTGKELGITAYTYGVQATATFGPYALKGMIWQAQNPTSFASLSYQPDANRLTDSKAFRPRYIAASKEIADDESIGGGLVATYDLSDVISFEVGYMFASHERQQPRAVKEKNDDRYYYINAPINVTKNFTITPEIGVIDLQDSVNTAGVKRDDGKDFYFGAYWWFGF